ncbi:Mu-like prophage major head subunit gpT family protein [Paenirhodobacter populi]|uniref:Mu-like prophage major head subunit gpT family protein n=1 Tax=Paenirhodobacter populi TaxID=2306993 RepID=UPI001F4FFD64|nr:Mu-like prophage major head subunit gpT family protein [Sinirhodobacter populi]
MSETASACRSECIANATLASQFSGPPMLINSQNLDLIFKGFKAVYSDATINAPVNYDKVAMVVPSASRDETYGWIGEFPQMREWIGPRQIKSLSAHDFTIKNLTFESTVEVPRNAISDDRIGIFKPMFAEMGQMARRHPDELVFGLLKSGFDTLCYDGQSFFDTDHPVLDKSGTTTVTISNMQAGTGEPWFLLDTSRAVRPIIWQEREPYEFQGITDATDERVFMLDKYLYGVRARVNAGFGLWQLAFGSKAELTAGNYAAARAAMQGFRAARGPGSGRDAHGSGRAPDA